MKAKLTWFDRIMAAVAFAEANEPDVGKDFLSGPDRPFAKEPKRKECEDLLASDLHGAEVSS